jgi:hypothetical protein
MAALNLVVAGEGFDDVVAAAERGIQPIPSTPRLACCLLRSGGLSCGEQRACQHNANFSFFGLAIL